MKKKAVAATAAAGTFRLVFRAEILAEQDPAAVRAAVVAVLRLDERRAAKLFSGQRTVVRRAVDENTALRYVARFAELGARLRAEPEPPPTWRPAFQQEFLLDPEDPAGTPWHLWRALGAVVLGTASLGILLHLWPGDFMAAPKAGAAGPGPFASAASSPPPPAAVSAPAMDAGNESDPLATLPPAALREYLHAYASVQKHKAFAVSDGGAFAWVGGLANSDAARESALSRCMAAPVAAEAGCSILDVDGALEK